MTCVAKATKPQTMNSSGRVRVVDRAGERDGEADQAAAKGDRRGGVVLAHDEVEFAMRRQPRVNDAEAGAESDGADEIGREGNKSGYQFGQGNQTPVAVAAGRLTSSDDVRKPLKFAVGQTLEIKWVLYARPGGFFRRSDCATLARRKHSMKRFGLIRGALIVGVVGVFASVANAQQAAPAAPNARHGPQGGPRRGPAERAAQLEQRFKEANKKGDGKLTLEEAQAGMPRVAENFTEIDKDKKGYVTLDEVKAALAAPGR